MAAVKTITKLTTNDAIVRITATADADTATIDISDDLKMTNETIGTPTVYVAAICHQTAANIKLTRNSVVVGHYFLNGVIESNDFAISDQATHDIVVTFGGAGMIILHLKKVSGYNTPFEPATFGSYDNPNAVGS